MATIQRARDRVRATIAEGEYDRALALVEVLRKHHPEDFETALLGGQIHLENGRYAEARRAFDSVLEVDPENVVARSGLALIAEEEGDLAAALVQFERAFNVNTSNSGIAEQIRRLRSQLRRGKPGDVGSAPYAVARRLLREKSYQEAVSIFEVALRVAPTEEAAVGMAQALFLVGRRTEAEALAGEILADHPRCLRALAILAAAAFSRGKPETLSYLSRTAALNPGNPVARALFREAGLPCPEVEEKLEVPEEERVEEAPERETALWLDVGRSAPCPAVVAEEEFEPEARPPIAGEVDDARASEPSPEPIAARDTESDGWISDRLAAALAEPAPEAGPGSSLVGAGEPSVFSARDRLPPGQEAVGESPTREEAGLRRPPRPESREEGARKPEPVGLRGDAALHLAFARSFESRGHAGFALEEYRKALRLDPSTAPAVREAASALAEADPANAGARWLVGDALVVEGQLRWAVEQYLMVLRGGARPRPG